MEWDGIGLGGAGWDDMGWGRVGRMRDACHTCMHLHVHMYNKCTCISIAECAKYCCTSVWGLSSYQPMHSVNYFHQTVYST